MKENLQKIREACIKANPEIVELKFGCWVKYWLFPAPLMFLRETRGGKHAVIKPEHMELKIDGRSGAIERIIGRPIRLADVLSAIEINPPKDEEGIDLERRIFMLCWYHWNLKQDDLEKQSPETIDFIASLL